MAKVKKVTKKTVKKIVKKSSGAKYVDGFLLPVPTAKLKEYQKMSDKARKYWLKYGALSYIESIGDDMNIEGMTGFNDYVKAGKDHTIVFSFITYKSKADRNRVNKKVMSDPLMATECGDPNNMPFDLKKMAFGGFKVIVGE